MGECAVRGRVVDAETGEPIGRASVHLHGYAVPGDVLAQVAADGSFEFPDVSAGKYTMSVISTAGYQWTPYVGEGVRKDLGNVFTLAVGEALEGVELRAEQAYQVSGRLSDERGQPLGTEDRVLIKAWRKLAEPGFAGSTYSATWRTRWRPRDSTFMIEGLDGTPVILTAAVTSADQTVTIYPPCYYPGTFSRDDATIITFDDERHVLGVDLRLRRTGGVVLAGTVTDEDTGEPVPEAMVLVHRLDMLWDEAIAYSDEAGRYRFECLGPGEFLIHVDASPAGYVRTRETVFLTDGDEGAAVDVTLRRGVRFAGKVVDVDGNPLDAVIWSGTAQIEEPQGGGWYRPANRHCPRSLWTGNEALYGIGDGDYSDAVMLILAESEFLIPSMMPGQIEFRFDRLPTGYRILKVLHDGADLTGLGFFTEPGESYEDITIVVGPKPEPQQ